MIGAYLVTRGEPTTLRALDSILPHVDRVVVAIDSRTDPVWDRAVAAHGVESYRFDFEALMSFAATFDDARDRLGCDWAIGMDADEVLQGGADLPAVVAQAEGDGVDLVWIPRRHWMDFRHARERTDWWPDFQPRLRRPNVRLRGRAHPAPVGAAKAVKTSRLVIDHYNLAIRGEAAWGEANRLYARMIELDGADPPHGEAVLPPPA